MQVNNEEIQNVYTFTRPQLRAYVRQMRKYYDNVKIDLRRSNAIIKANIVLGLNDLLTAKQKTERKQIRKQAKIEMQAKINATPVVKFTKSEKKIVKNMMKSVMLPVDSSYDHVPRTRFEGEEPATAFFDPNIIEPINQDDILIKSKKLSNLIRNASKKYNDVGDVIADAFIPKMAAVSYPYYARAFFHNERLTKNEGDSPDVDHVTKYEKFTHRITSDEERNKYIKDAANRLLKYDVLTDQGVKVGMIRFDVEISKPKQKRLLLKVARYAAENCVLNVVRAHLGDQKVDKLYKKYPQLIPKVDERGNKLPVYVDHAMIEAISKSMRINICTYTEFGARIGMPWHTYGTGRRLKVHIKISNEHATMMREKLRPKAIVYDLNGTIPSDTNVIDWDYYFNPNENPYECLPNPKYYTQLINNKPIIHKNYRPSFVSKNPDDDLDLKYAYVFTDEQMMYSLFIQKYDLKIIENDIIRNIVKASEHFVGRRIMKPLEADVTHIDNNKNFIAYEKLPYYQGFPTNKLLPTTLANALNPAFVIAKNMTKVPESFRWMFNYKAGQIVLQYPLYAALLDLGCKVEVDYVLDGEFQHISVIDFADSFEVGPAAIKLFRNQLIGRTITGGVRETKVIRCVYNNDVEKEQMIFEAQSKEYKYAVDDKQKTLSVELPSKPKGLFNFHSYILAYAAIHVINKWEDLRRAGREIVGYNVDALLIKGKYYEHSEEIGGWKTEPIKQNSMFRILSVNTEIEQPVYDIPDIRVPQRVVPRCQTLIKGPAGISKSYPWLIDPAFDQIVLTYTLDLADNHKKRFSNVCTAHKYFQFGVVDDKNWLGMRLAGKIPREYAYVVVDEFTMFTKSMWDIMHRRKGNSIIISLGDFEQIISEATGPKVNDRYFKSHGYDSVVLERELGKIARHSYDYGCKLDGMRGLCRWDQLEYVRNNFDCVADIDMQKIDVTVDRVIVGNHNTAREYTKNALDALDKEALFPFKTIAKRSKRVLLPINTPNVFWNRTSMMDKPDGFKYEPAFAITADSIQGGTITDGTLYVDANSLHRHGTLYVAMTRTVEESKTVPVYRRTAEDVEYDY